MPWRSNVSLRLILLTHQILFNFFFFFFFFFFFKKLALFSCFPHFHLFAVINGFSRIPAFFFLLSFFLNHDSVARRMVPRAVDRVDLQEKSDRNPFRSSPKPIKSISSGFEPLCNFCTTYHVDIRTAKSISVGAAHIYQSFKNPYSILKNTKKSQKSISDRRILQVTIFHLQVFKKKILTPRDAPRSHSYRVVYPFRATCGAAGCLFAQRAAMITKINDVSEVTMIAWKNDFFEIDRWFRFPFPCVDFTRGTNDGDLSDLTLRESSVAIHIGWC